MDGKMLMDSLVGKKLSSWVYTPDYELILTFEDGSTLTTHSDEPVGIEIVSMVKGTL